MIPIDGNEKVLHTPLRSKTGASLSDEVKSHTQDTIFFKVGSVLSLLFTLSWFLSLSVSRIILASVYVCAYIYIYIYIYINKTVC